jgi:restriction system protein
MARREESILHLLVECPWWVSVLVSGIAFVSLRFILPSIDFGGMAANSFAKGLSSAAWLVALVLLLPAPIAALNSWVKRKRPQRRSTGRRTDKKRSISGR